MKELYVIVHPLTLLDVLRPNDHIGQIIKVMGYTSMLKLTKQYIESHVDPADLDAQLPPPSDDLTIKLCGRYAEICVKRKRKTFLEQGYNVEIYEPATLYAYGRPRE